MIGRPCAPAPPITRTFFFSGMFELVRWTERLYKSKKDDEFCEVEKTESI